jgi:hypothetical protein
MKRFRLSIAGFEIKGYIEIKYSTQIIYDEQGFREKTEAFITVSEEEYINLVNVMNAKGSKLSECDVKIFALVEHPTSPSTRDEITARLVDTAQITDAPPKPNSMDNILPPERRATLHFSCSTPQRITEPQKNLSNDHAFYTL